MNRAQMLSDVDQLVGEAPEAPGLVGLRRCGRGRRSEKPAIELDDAADEARRKNADAAVVERLSPAAAVSAKTV